MELIYGLRKICGHDSFSVEGCVTCAAADEIERLKAELEELHTAYDELRLLADGRLSIKPEYVRDIERQLAEANDKFNRCNEARIQTQKESDHNKSMWDGSARRVVLLESQLAEAREEVESIGYKPLAVIKEEVRQEAARECYEIGNKLLQQGYVTTVISKYMYEIQAKFKLEG